MATKPTEPLVLTQVEAAELLKVSDRTIRNWERQGIIAGTKVRGVKRYPYAKLKKLVS